MTPTDTVLFASFIGWPEVIVILAVLGLLAMWLGILDNFKASKEGGVKFTARAYADARVLTALTKTIEEIDNHNRFKCWNHVVDNPPTFATLCNQRALSLPLLEMAAFNHVMRAIDAGGFEAYEEAKMSAVFNAANKQCDMVKLREWVLMILSQCITSSRDAAAKKVDIYEFNMTRRDLSQECRDEMSRKADKNRRYMMLRRAPIDMEPLPVIVEEEPEL